MTTTATRPRRGRSQPLGNGLRRLHTVTCTLAGCPDTCDCPFMFWKPRCTPRERVKVVGTMQDALRLRSHMQRAASGTIHMTQRTPIAATPIPGAATPIPTHSPAPTQHPPRFGQWAQQVMETVWLRHAATTRQSRKSVYRNHVEPHLANTPVSEITAHTVEAWLATLTTNGVSLHMQRQAYDVVRTITGIWHERLGQSNPVAVVKRPVSPTSNEKRAKDCTLTARQYQRVIAACQTTAEELLIRCATEAGLRLDELAGLQRRDVNLAAKTITVRRQGSRSTTKSTHARTITIIGTGLLDALTTHLTDMTAAGFTMPDAYIWQGGHGPRLPENNRPYGKVGIAKIIRRVLTRAGLERVTRPHGLRATGAQLLIEAGASLELVSQHLGHAHIRTTEEYYVGRVNTSGLAQFDGAFG